MNRTEQALAIAKQITLKEMELEELRATFGKFVHPEAGPVTTLAAVAQLTPRPVSTTGTAGERILRFMASIAGAPGEVVGPSNVSMALPDLDVKLVRNTLVRLAERGDLEKVRRGEYRIASQAQKTG